MSEFRKCCQYCYSTDIDKMSEGYQCNECGEFEEE